MKLKEKILITIVGPTAIGKTSLSIALAQHFQTEIISCDSRQFYKEMNIGTAVPELFELEAVQHHFIQNRSIFKDYNVGAFEKDALFKLEELFKKHDIIIMVGGSGLYVDAVLKGFDEFPEVNPQIRKDLTKQLEEEGLITLQEKLRELDPETYNTIALDNPQRVSRALEICIETGLPYSSFKGKSKEKRKFKSIKIGLNGDRDKIYERINLRVNLMIENGLINEAKGLFKYKNLNALQAVGYKELFSYFNRDSTKEFAIQEIKKNTRRFAKRQLTWFRKDADINWFDFQEDIQTIITQIEQKL